MLNIYTIHYKIKRGFIRLKSNLYYKYVFNEFGVDSWIEKPLKLINPNHIRIGCGTSVFYRTLLAADPNTGKRNAELVIGNNCRIGYFNHIYSSHYIEIQDYVTTAPRVYISDNRHNYEDISKPIKQQNIIQLNKVIIGSGSTIGINVCIIGASIGKNCIVGSNSVVTKDIPDYCVAVGAPARVIKRYNTEKNIWEKV